MCLNFGKQIDNIQASNLNIKLVALKNEHGCSQNILF